MFEKPYLIPFITYLSLPLLLAFLLEKNTSYIISIIATTTLILFNWKEYNLKSKISNKDLLLTMILTTLIYLSWILLDGKYHLFSAPDKFTTKNNIEIVFRFIGFVLLTPLVEELFTRGFLIKFTINKDFKKVKTGTFTWFSFIITVLFFGFSHAEWLQGIIAGIILNIIYYKTKRIEMCILAHAVVNLLLFI